MVQVQFHNGFCRIFKQWALRGIFTGTESNFTAPEKLCIESIAGAFFRSCHLAYTKRRFYIWLTFKKELSVEMIFQEALKHRILLNPGDIYGFEKTNSLRLSFSYVTPEEFALAAETLAQVVRHGV